MQRPFSYHIYKSGLHSIQERNELQAKQIELHFFILLTLWLRQMQGPLHLNIDM